MAETTEAGVRALIERQKANRARIRATSAKERVKKLTRLQRAIEDRFGDLQKAVHADLQKCESETRITELYPVMAEIKHVRRYLGEWMRPEPVPAPLPLFGSENEIERIPKGVVLILSPWNYPFNLTLSPLVSAIAAGNCAIVKPSEMSPHTSRFIHELVSSVFEENEIAVLEGDHRLARLLVGEPFDHIFFTGSPKVGSEVMVAAARNLTPVTLELGGKSPVILDASADLGEAAAKIAWGKTINAGQSCVAPDYVLVPTEYRERFVALLVKSFEKRLGPLGELGSNPDYGRIINQRHFLRLKDLLDSAVRDGARIEMGGEHRAEERYMAPTILTQVPVESPILHEEIFGPLLPVVGTRSRKEAIAFVASRPRPLALYVFGKSSSAVETILKETESGDAVVNDVVVHFGNVNLPFGGFNTSGIGKSHGRAGFEAFSHTRAVMRQPKWSPPRLLYPPYTFLVQRLIRFTVKYL
jgi:aldehyde dehydrogenase (NAD+)